jgi:predicted small lipoprotein YifL
MSQRKSLVLACLALSALSVLAGCGQSGGNAIAADPPSNSNSSSTSGSTGDPTGLTQNWDKNLPSGSRFTVLTAFNNQAVRDNETGLVWERSPSSSTVSWYDAVRTCWQRQVGGRMGWHLPTIEELSTLVDPTVPATGPALPSGHPFTNVIASTYWSTTTDVRVPFLPTQAWEVRFGIPGQVGDSGKDNLQYFWCVRGSGNGDKYK